MTEDLGAMRITVREYVSMRDRWEREQMADRRRLSLYWATWGFSLGVFSTLLLQLLMSAL